MSQDWNFGPQDPNAYDPDQPPPTPQRFRKVLRREQHTHDSLRPKDQPGAPPVAPSDRDAKGRFTTGNKGGTGNPFARQTAALRTALMEAVTEDDMAELAAVLLAKAKSGDLAAMKLLFTYVLGKPTEAPNPDRLELEDYELLKERLCPLRADWDLIRDMTPVEGIVEAGHTVADLRAANWRAQVLGAEAPSQQCAAADQGAGAQAAPSTNGTRQRGRRHQTAARWPRRRPRTAPTGTRHRRQTARTDWRRYYLDILEGR